MARWLGDCTRRIESLDWRRVPRANSPLVERFLAGWVPAGLDQSRLEELRLWWAHGILWWAGLNLSIGADPDADLTGIYAAARHSVENDDPVSWLARDAAAAAP